MNYKQAEREMYRKLNSAGVEVAKGFAVGDLVEWENCFDCVVRGKVVAVDLGKNRMGNAGNLRVEVLDDPTKPEKYAHEVREIVIILASNVRKVR